MKFLLLLSAVVFVLGTVNGCNQSKRTACINDSKARELKTDADKCRGVNAVRVCVVIDAECSEDDTNSAAIELMNQLKLDCKTIDENWEKEGKCITKKAACGHEYNTRIKGKEEDQIHVCSAIGDYLTCMKTGECKRHVISYEMNQFMKRSKIDRCENIHFEICDDEVKYETCLAAFDGAVVNLDLKEDEKTLCMLAGSVEHCYRTKAKCSPQTIKEKITSMLNNVDCSENVDLCDHTKEVLCSMKYPNPDNCGTMKDYQTCLSANATCPAGRVHHILRNVMEDRKLDCADASACEYVKETNCEIDVAIPEITTTEKKCKLFNQYKNCMVRARCNLNYMNSRFGKVNTLLNYPCGASSILASIGLTLLLVSFTGLWK